MQEPLIDELVVLEKFPGKGGWTYALLPEKPLGEKKHFGWQKANVLIDDYEYKNCSLMPMGKGKLFIAVKAEIRKVIRKQAGDLVRIQLFPLEASLPLPEDFLLCLEDEPNAKMNFNKLTEAGKQQLTDWIYGIKSEKLIIDRMAVAINQLALGQVLNFQKKP